MENVGIFYDCLEYVVFGHFLSFKAIWYSLWSFGIFFPFGKFGPRKIWQPCLLSTLPKPLICQFANVELPTEIVIVNKRA
jgi:hypothetical protein